MKIRVLAVASALMLTACVKDGKMTLIDDLGNTFQSSSQTNLSPEEIDSNKNEKAVSKANLIGTAAGASVAAAACKLAMGRECGSMEMLMFAAGGAVVGNMATNQMNNEKHKFVASQESLNNHIELAKANNKKLSKFVSDVEKTVKLHEKNIQSLKAAAKDDESKLAELNDVYAKMEKNHKVIKDEIKITNEKINKLESQVAQYEEQGYDSKNLGLALEKTRKYHNKLTELESSTQNQDGNVQSG